MNIGLPVCVIAAAALLLGCGGGGGGEVQSPLAAASTEMFPLSQAWQNYLTETQNKTPFTLLATVKGQDIPGAGTLTTAVGTESRSENNVPITYQFKRTIHSIGIQDRGVTRTTITSSSLYFDGATPLFSVTQASGFVIYSAINPPVTIPSTGRVGDSGDLFTATVYRDSPTGAKYGSTTYRYSLEADTSQTALLVITSKYVGVPAPVDDSTVETYRIDTQGTLQRVSEVYASTAQDAVVTITY